MWLAAIEPLVVSPQGFASPLAATFSRFDSITHVSNPTSNYSANSLKAASFSDVCLSVAAAADEYEYGAVAAPGRCERAFLPRPPVASHSSLLSDVLHRMGASCGCAFDARFSGKYLCFKARGIPSFPPEMPLELSLRRLEEG